MKTSVFLAAAASVVLLLLLLSSAATVRASGDELAGSTDNETTTTTLTSTTIVATSTTAVPPPPPPSTTITSTTTTVTTTTTLPPVPAADNVVLTLRLTFGTTIASFRTAVAKALGCLEQFVIVTVVSKNNNNKNQLFLADGDNVTVSFVGTNSSALGQKFVKLLDNPAVVAQLDIAAVLSVSSAAVNTLPPSDLITFYLMFNTRLTTREQVEAAAKIIAASVGLADATRVVIRVNTDAPTNATMYFTGSDAAALSHDFLYNVLSVNATAVGVVAWSITAETAAPTSAPDGSDTTAIIIGASVVGAVVLVVLVCVLRKRNDGRGGGCCGGKKDDPTSPRMEMETQIGARAADGYRSV